MAIRKSSNSGIPFGNTAGRPTAATGQPYFNGETGRLELYTSTGWQNIVQETPGVASVSGTYNESAGSGTFTVYGTNFVDGSIAYAVGTNGTEYQASTTTYNSIVQVTAVFSNLSTAYEPYDIKIVNPSSLFGLLPDAFYINDSPVWSTTAGSLGTFNSGNAVSVQLSATDDESNTISYSVSSGSLPGGLSLSSGGLISGTLAASSGTYSFTVSASDGANTGQTRSFSITSVAAIITGGTLSSDSTYYYRTFTGTGNLIVSSNSLNADILAIAGGGAGGPHQGAGGGGGGVVYFANQSLSPATYSVEVGGGGTSSQNLQGTQTNGINSSFASLAAAVRGGAGGMGSTNGASGGSGGGGGGANASPTGTGGSSTQTGTGATAFYGNAGGNGSVGNTTATGGGGGGAGAAGANAVNNAQAGAGGIGTSVFSTWGSATLTGQNVNGTYYYAGGGGGGADERGSGTAGAGGSGGGGAGVKGTSPTTATSGTANTGGGGGGGSAGDGGVQTTSGAGGSGIVIIRYTKASVGG